LAEGGDPLAALRAYEAARSEPTAQVVRTNREHPPDYIIGRVEELVGDKPFDDLDRYITQAELQRLSDDDIGWDQAAQVFVLDISVHQTIVEATEFFDLRARVRIRSGGALVDVTDPVVNPIISSPGVAPDAQGFVQLPPTKVPWDRNSGTFSGNATVIGSVALLSNRERLVERNTTIA
jgi:hypothetical protein